MKQSAEFMDATQTERMHCMEVWGGNRATNKRLQMPGLDTWIFSQPYHGADGGGDVHYVSACASGRLTRILLADVSGHGASAAHVGAALKDLMRQNVNVIRQDNLVSQVNEEFTKSTTADRFATAVVCSYFAPTKALELCNAGHPVPLVYRNQNGSWMTIEQTEGGSQPLRDLPLGIYETANYSKKKLRLQKDDLVLFYSDALIEAVDASGRQIGVDGLVHLLSGLQVSDGSTISNLLAAIMELNPINLQEDDATIILLKATDTPTSLKDNLLSPFRLFGKPRDRTEIARYERVESEST